MKKLLLAKNRLVLRLLKSFAKRLKELQNVIQRIVDKKYARIVLEAKKMQVLEPKQAVLLVVAEEKTSEIELRAQELKLKEEAAILFINKMTDAQLNDFLSKSNFKDEDVRISFVIPSRIKNNPTFNLKGLLDSCIEYADDIKRCEFLIIVDIDDDLHRYVELKKDYANKVRLKILISKKRYSFFHLHKYWKIGFENMSNYSKMYNLCSDDMRMNQKGFDSIVLDIDAKYSDNVYIIHTTKFDGKKLFGRNYHLNTDIIHDDYRMIFFLMSTDGVAASYYPFVARSFYQEAQKLQEEGIVHEKDDWAYIANCYAADWYSSILGDYISALGLTNRVFYLDNFTARNMQTTSDHHVKRDEYGFEEYRYLIQKFFEKSTINHMRRIALAVSKRVKK